MARRVCGKVLRYFYTAPAPVVDPSPALAVSHAAPAFVLEYTPPATAVCSPPALDVECTSPASVVSSRAKRSSEHRRWMTFTGVYVNGDGIPDVLLVGFGTSAQYGAPVQYGAPGRTRRGLRYPGDVVPKMSAPRWPQPNRLLGVGRVCAGGVCSTGARLGGPFSCSQRYAGPALAHQARGSFQFYMWFTLEHDHTLTAERGIVRARHRSCSRRST